MFRTGCLLVLICLAACVEDKVLPSGSNVEDTTKIDSNKIGRGSLIINEFIAKACPGGSTSCTGITTYTATERKVV